MSQHLIDTERRSSASRDEGYEAGAHNGGSTGNAARHRHYGGSDAHLSNETDDRRAQRDPDAPAYDAALDALDALGEALEQLTKDRQLLEGRLKDLHRAREDGRPWREILADEDPPGTMQIVSRMLACLAKASGTLRKDLVDNLRREGVSIPAIAKLFGVTHQRVSNLLRRPSA
ncbi:MAG: hypothetical protein ACRDWE_13760 [Acidimicrobiales bacterium]